MLNIKKIEECRKKAGLSQAQLAEKLGISDTTYTNLSKTRDFRATTLEKIAKLFGVSMAYLFDEHEELTQNEQINNADEPLSSYGLKSENELLKKRIQDLEKIIKLLEQKK